MKKFLHSAALFLFFASVELCHSQSPQTGPTERHSSGSEDERMKRIVKLIRQMPNFEMITSDELKHESLAIRLSNRAMKIAKAVSRFSDEEIEVTIKAHYGNLEPPSDEILGSGRIYLLNRYLFNVSEHVNFDKYSRTSPFFGGWRGMPGGDGWFNQLWPLGYDHKHRLIIKYSFGGYNGPDYEPLQEFEHFKESYQRRKF